MSTINTVLEVLWASERVLASESLTPDEKEVILSELKIALPSASFHCTRCPGTRAIVEAKMNIAPSIITDETPTKNDTTPASNGNRTKAKAKNH